MNENEVIEKLRSQGYDNVRVYEAIPGEVDEEHSHDYDTKLHILDGEIRIKLLSGEAMTDFRLQAGDEKDIPMGQLHSARVGPEGCRYVVAEKHGEIMR